MLMKMLVVGGMKPLTDNVRKRDEDNPNGYYEYDRVKRLERDKEWLPAAKGKVVKIISILLKHLPSEYSYKLIFMLRDLDEIIASQKQMLIRRGEPTDKMSDEDLAKTSKGHLKQVEEWLAKKANIEVLYIRYNEILRNPLVCSKRINEFLGNKLDEAKMASTVDINLYRQRR
jgi:hypothetical protein